MRHFVLYLRLLLVGGLMGLSFAGSAWAQPVAVSQSTLARFSHLDTPLMVIRFNQRNVYFQRPLFSAVSKALDTKPDVEFHLISYVPKFGAGTSQERIKERADKDLGAVVTSMREMGVPKQRIRAVSKHSSYVRDNEVHIYVR